MLRASPRKIKSAPKTWPFVAVVGAVVVVNLFYFSSYLLRGHGQDERSLLLGSRVYSLEVVTSEKDQQHGLSDRASIPRDHGMLFDFGDEGQRCIWMKDMHFPLDIIWADGDKKVTLVQRNVSPSTYPTAYCSDARYVVEVNAGTVSNRLEQAMKTGYRLTIR